MLLKLFLGFCLLVALLLVFIVLRPADFRYSRSLTIAAPPEILFQQVNDLHKFQDWNPWAKLDPNAMMEYSGPATGVGAGYRWAGNNDVGEGAMTIVESKPAELVRCRMDFKKPMEATNMAEFTFKPEAGETVVTWSMSGKNGLMGKAFGLFVNCDKMVGDQFAKGLATLKANVESAK